MQLLLLGLLFFDVFPASASGTDVVAPNPIMILPFALLLLAIAIVPVFGKQWWEKYHPAVSIGLGASTAVYYIFFLENSSRVLHAGMEYLSLIVLIGSLFVVSGGIYIQVKGRSTPFSNLALLGTGAILSNLLGTIGASMILIRPYLRMNRYRLCPSHVVFFIFIVSNMGGALAPIGNPPLFLGYLRGVPFFLMIERMWDVWFISIGIVLAVFFVIDRIGFRKFQQQSVSTSAPELHEVTTIKGFHNIAFLAVVLAAMFIERPPLLREFIMAAAAVASHATTKSEIHRKNDFTSEPIKEVAILFFGIFATIVPALDWLELNAAKIGISSVGQFYWGTGILSSVLDNAPTYLSFFSASIGLFVDQGVVQQVQYLIEHAGTSIASAHAAEVRSTLETLVKYQAGLVANGHVPVESIRVAYIVANQGIYLKAISVASVFFGALTYIGNVPNLMVKSVAEHMGVKTPTFIGYVLRYSLPILVPIFALVWLLFFR